MSCIGSGILIYALPRHESTNRQVSLYWGVFLVYFPTIPANHAGANQEAKDITKYRVRLKMVILLSSSRVICWVSDSNKVNSFVVKNQSEFFSAAFYKFNSDNCR
jgi:pyruvate kinase